MIVSYGLRLLCACLACLFLAQAVATVALCFLWQASARVARRMPAAGAARLILIMRLLPTAIALGSVAMLCIPSYLQFEPDSKSEEVGLLCLALALLGFSMCVVSVRRAMKAVIPSARQRRACAPGISHELMCVVEASAPLCALSGILRPRLLISRAVLEALSAEELAVAIKHERAHLRSLDNLKRLMLLLAPRLPGTIALEREWARFSEFAADDEAGGGNAERSLALASALVRVARLGTAPAPTIAATLIGNQQDLAERVERLLTVTGSRVQNRIDRAAWWIAATLTVSAAACLISSTPLYGVHTLIEALMH
jgi:hypothetical protein